MYRLEQCTYVDICMESCTDRSNVRMLTFAWSYVQTRAMLTFPCSYVQTGAIVAYLMELCTDWSNTDILYGAM